MMPILTVQASQNARGCDEISLQPHHETQAHGGRDPEMQLQSLLNDMTNLTRC